MIDVAVCMKIHQPQAWRSWFLDTEISAVLEIIIFGHRPFLASFFQCFVAFSVYTFLLSQRCSVQPSDKLFGAAHHAPS